MGYLSLYFEKSIIVDFKDNKLTEELKTFVDFNLDEWDVEIWGIVSVLMMVLLHLSSAQRSRLLLIEPMCCFIEATWCMKPDIYDKTA